MPKLKLRDWQFELMYRCVRKASDCELTELHKLISTHFNEEIICAFSTVKNKAEVLLEKLSKKKDLLSTKIHLFKLEHDNETSEESEKVLSEYQTNLYEVESLIQKINDSIALIEKLDNIAETIQRKSSEKDYIKSYDDDPITDALKDGDDWPFPYNY